MIAISASGTNFRTVVMTCTTPDCRVPSTLIAVTTQINAMPMSAASRLFVPRSPQNTAR